MANAIGWSVADPREMPGEIRALATEIMPGMPGWAVDRKVEEMQDRLAKDVKERSKLYKYRNEELKKDLTAGMNRKERAAYERIFLRGAPGYDGIKKRNSRRGKKSAQAKAAARASDEGLQERMAKVFELRKGGMKFRAIEEISGVPKSTAQRWIAAMTNGVVPSTM